MRTRVIVRTLFTAFVLLTLGLAVRAEENPKVGQIEGTVRFQGKPLPGGTVSFHPDKGKPFVAQLQDDGSYTLKDVPVGAMRVTIETESLKNPAKPPKGGKKYVPIPRAYADPKTSGLTYTMLEGRQAFDIELK